MLTLPANLRVFVAEAAVDFRKSFDGLSAIVEHQFGMEPTSGHLFLFLNKRKNQVRLLFWERDGLCLIAKRLESGTFRRITRDGNQAAHFEIDTMELMLLLEGVDVTSMQRRKRFTRQHKSTSHAENRAPA